MPFRAQLATVVKRPRRWGRARGRERDLLSLRNEQILEDQSLNIYRDSISIDENSEVIKSKLSFVWNVTSISPRVSDNPDVFICF